MDLNNLGVEHDMIPLEYNEIKIHVPRINPAKLSSSILKIKEQREKYLLHLKPAEIITDLAQLSQLWLNKEYPIRKKAVELMMHTTQLSKEHLNIAFDIIFSTTQFSHIQTLFQEIKKSPVFQHSPELITHILAGIIPSPCLYNLIMGLLVKSANIIKCPSQEPVFPIMLHQSLQEINPSLAACILVSWWQGGDRKIEDDLFHRSDIVCAFGRNLSLEKIHRHIPTSTDFIPYGQRISLGLILKEATKETAHRVSWDICLFDQQGCLSPHTIYVEEGGLLSLTGFAQILVEEMTKTCHQLPLGNISLDRTAQIQSLRGQIEAKEASGEKTFCYSNHPHLDWTVIVDQDPSFTLSPLNRVIYIKPLPEIDRLPHLLTRWKNYLQAIGYAGPLNRIQDIVPDLNALGVNRICPLGQMQKPPLHWHHDGKDFLENTGSWIDIETP